VSRHSLREKEVSHSTRPRYLSSPSVSTKQNITWAGQTFGRARFQADGRLTGTEHVITINCDQTANSCTIPVKAPGFALVFLDSGDAELGISQATKTFATTALTRLRNTVTIASSVLETSNGHNGSIRRLLGATSPRNETRFGNAAEGVGGGSFGNGIALVFCFLVGVAALLLG